MANGMEVLLHIGIDTVDMNGDGFEYPVSQGQKVKAGDRLITMDLDKVEKAGYLTDVMVVVLEEGGLPDIAYQTGMKAEKGITAIAEY